MASIEKRSTASGVVYRITVCNGKNPETGERIRYRKTYTPEPGMTARQAKKAAERVAMDFERQIEAGYAVFNRQTFAEFAPHALKIKKVAGVRIRTIERYEELLVRINQAIGHIPLTDLRARHLNEFYHALLTSGVRNCPGHATVKIDLAALLHQRNMSRAALAAICELSAATVGDAVRGRSVTAATADAIAATLGMATAEIFEITYDQRPLSPKTVLEHHRLIHTILECAVNNDLIEYNVADKATPPKYKRPMPNYFQPDDAIRILEALDKEPLLWRVLTHTLAITTARRGEICAIKWHNIDFEHRTIHIFRGMVSTRESGLIEDDTKESDHRVLKLPMETIELMQQLRTEQAKQLEIMGVAWQENRYVFTSDMSNPIHPDSVTHWLAEFSNRHGLPHINPHAFRHSAASILLSKGYDVSAVSKYLGHSTPTTTLNFYSHVIASILAQSCECLADTLLRNKA